MTYMNKEYRNYLRKVKEDLPKNCKHLFWVELKEKRLRKVFIAKKDATIVAYDLAIPF